MFMSVIGFGSVITVGVMTAATLAALLRLRQIKEQQEKAKRAKAPARKKSS